MGVSIKIEGLDELKETLNTIAPNEALNILRSTVHGVAGEVANKMKERAPEASGNLRKAIHTVRRRGTPNEVVSDVRIRHGKGQKFDAWYWFFQEFGTVLHSAQPFITPSVEELRGQLPEIFRQQFGKKFEAAMKRKAKRAART